MNRTIYGLLVFFVSLGIGFVGYTTPPVWESWEASIGMPALLMIPFCIAAWMVFAGKLWSALIGASTLWYGLGLGINMTLRGFGFQIFDLEHLATFLGLMIASVALLVIATWLNPNPKKSDPEPNADDSGKAMGGIAMLGYFGLPIGIMIGWTIWLP